jgi:hypothetical protein
MPIGSDEESGLYDRSTLLKTLFSSEMTAYDSLPFLPLFYKEEDEKLVFNNPISWWNDRKERFLHLSLLAFKLLGIPATSAPRERDYSHGLTTSDHSNIFYLNMPREQSFSREIGTMCNA